MCNLHGSLDTPMLPWWNWLVTVEEYYDHDKQRRTAVTSLALAPLPIRAVTLSDVCCFFCERASAFQTSHIPLGSRGEEEANLLQGEFFSPLIVLVQAACNRHKPC
jgi:hypothetical protein